MERPGNNPGLSYLCCLKLCDRYLYLGLFGLFFFQEDYSNHPVSARLPCSCSPVVHVDVSAATLLLKTILSSAKSTSTVSPSLNVRSSIFRASSFKTDFCSTLFRGRAPYNGSNPTAAKYSFALSVNIRSIFFSMIYFFILWT